MAPRAWIDVSQLSGEQRRYTELEYESVEERPEGLRVTLRSGHRTAFFHQELYGHSAERKVIAVPAYVAVMRGCRSNGA